VPESPPSLECQQAGVFEIRGRAPREEAARPAVAFLPTIKDALWIFPGLL